MLTKNIYIADIHLRFIAGFIDLLIIQALMFFLYKLFDFLTRASRYEYLTNFDDNIYFGIGFLVSFFLVIFIYFSVQHVSFSQASVGKRIVGIEVVNKEGQAITGKQSRIRAFVKILGYMFFFISGPLIVFSSHAESLEDRMAGTYVVLKKTSIEN